MASGVRFAVEGLPRRRFCMRWGARKYASGYTEHGSWRVGLMPYSLHDDNLYRDPRWAVMARLGEPEGSDVLEMAPARRRVHLARLEARKRHLFCSHQLMTLETAANTDDGYLTLEAALACCGGEAWQVKALASAVCGKPPFLHRKGDECSAKNCIDSSPPWPDGYEFRVCAFLKKNPSRAERERTKAQNDDARNPLLKALLLRRDGRFCRYCRSGPLSEKAGRAIERRKVLQRDHINPDNPAGPNGENYATSCASCNEHKGRMTPFEAELVLLPPPTPEQLVEWTARGLWLAEPPWLAGPVVAESITDGSLTDHRPTSDPHGDSDGDPHSDPQPGPDTDTAVPARPETATNQQEHPHDHQQGGFGSGRVGPPAGGDPSPARLGPGGQPVRDQSDPDIYHRRPRAPANQPGRNGGGGGDRAP